jgi:hypothetical protein
MTNSVPASIKVMARVLLVCAPAFTLAGCLQPAAWIGNQLYVEPHPDKAQADQIDMNEAVSRSAPAGLREAETTAAGANSDAIDWIKADAAGMEGTGLPVAVAGTVVPAHRRIDPPLARRSRKQRRRRRADAAVR